MIKSIAFISIAAILCQGITSIRSLVLARFVSPEEYGVWTGLQLLISLAPIACLGTVEALVKEVSFLRGKQDESMRAKVEGSVFTSLIVASCFLFVISTLVGLFPFFEFVRENPNRFRLTALTAGLGFFSAFYYFRAISFEDFKLVSLLETFRAIVTTAGIIIPAKTFGIDGAIIGYFFMEVIVLVAFGTIGTRIHGSVKPCFSSALIFDSIKIGLPITLIWWIYAVQNGVGRMVSMSFLGKEITGYLGVAGSLATAMVLIPNMVARVLYPKMNAQLGAKKSASDLRDSVIKPVTLLAVIIPLAQMFVNFSLPPLYFKFLTKYSPGLLCSQILVTGAFFGCIIRNGVNFLIASNRHRLLVGYVMLTVILSAIFSLLAIRAGFGINGIAVAVSASAAVLTSLIWIRVFNELSITSSCRVELFQKICLPFGIAVVCMVMVGFIHISVTSLVLNALFQQSISILLYLCICCAFGPVRDELVIIVKHGLMALCAKDEQLKPRPA